MLALGYKEHIPFGSEDKKAKKVVNPAEIYLKWQIEALSGEKNLHLLERNKFDKPTNNSSRLLFTNINFFHVQRISIWMLLNFSNNPNTDIEPTDR